MFLSSCFSQQSDFGLSDNYVLSIGLRCSNDWRDDSWKITQCEVRLETNRNLGNGQLRVPKIGGPREKTRLCCACSINGVTPHILRKNCVLNEDHSHPRREAFGRPIASSKGLSSCCGLFPWTSSWRQLGDPRNFTRRWHWWSFGGFHKWGYPRIIHFTIFSIVNHPFGIALF